jgi:hypothetical protein
LTTRTRDFFAVGLLDYMVIEIPLICRDISIYTTAAEHYALPPFCYPSAAIRKILRHDLLGAAVTDL